MKKTLTIIFLVIWLVFGVYLLLPAPHVADLPNSLKSDEPGDTWQVPHIAGYYNNLTREQVLSYYKNQFAITPFGNLPLPTYNLNHPPEYAKERIRDELRAWYFEELVHPFRESLYVSGWTPALAQLSLGWRELPVEKNGVFYYQKTTIRAMPTTGYARLGVYVLLTGALFSLYYVGKKALRAPLWQEQ